MTNNDYVKPPQKKQEEYVAPTKVKNDDYVAPPTETVPPSKTENTNYVSPPKNNSYVEVKKDRGYFDTPKIGLKFYMSVYLFLSLYLIWSDNNDLMYDFYSAVQDILATIYVVISNYTYCWFADYRRHKGGFFGWFFQPLAGAKGAYLTSTQMDFSKAHTRKSMWGGYTTTYSSGLGDRLWYIIIFSIIIEFLKYIIICPLAFISLFTHKHVVDKYLKELGY